MSITTSPILPICACDAITQPSSLSKFLDDTWASCQQPSPVNSINYPNPAFGSFDAAVTQIALYAPPLCHLVTPAGHFVKSKCNLINPSSHFNGIDHFLNNTLEIPPDFEGRFTDCYFSDLKFTLVTDIKSSGEEILDGCNTVYEKVSSTYQQFLRICQKAHIL